MEGFKCPYCGMVVAQTSSTVSTQYPAFGCQNGWYHGPDRHIENESTIAITFYCCPNCNSYTVTAKGVGKCVLGVNSMLQPKSNAIQFPEYIPEQIRKDYEEACAIVSLSPKASASLSRRCLQGMIRDYWGIVKNKLYDEISELKAKVQPDLWQAIDSLRQLGNIGAHMEKDVDLIVDIDPGETEKLIKLIELLMKEWYINREERNKLFGDILQINADKQATRKGEG